MCNDCDRQLCTYPCTQQTPYTDHCHWEIYDHESRGVLGQTSTSSSRGCCQSYRHHKCSPDVQCRKGSCDEHERHRRCTRSRSRSRSHSRRTNKLVHELEDLLKGSRRNRDLSKTVDDLLRQQRHRHSHRDGDANVLEDVLGQLLNRSSPIHRRSRSPTSSSNDRDILVDLLCRITSTSNSTSTRVRDNVYEQPNFTDLHSAWVGRNGTPTSMGYPVYTSGCRPRMGYPAAPVMHSMNARMAPRYLGGCYR